MIMIKFVLIIFLLINLNTCNACFHESTQITYKNKIYTMKDILSNSENQNFECRIPHIVNALGVDLDIKCSKSYYNLKLTHDHLVFTQQGFKAAKDLHLNDIVYNNIDHDQHDDRCKMIDLVQIEQDEKYFGLNCIKSIVLANGIKTSTFGDYHVIPAFWMKYISKIIRLDNASHIGNIIAIMYYTIMI